MKIIDHLILAVRQEKKIQEDLENEIRGHVKMIHQINLLEEEMKIERGMKIGGEKKIG